MKLIDAHVKASVENFAGQRRDTIATRAAVEASIVDLANTLVGAARNEARSIPTLTSEVPQASPQKSKRARIFGG